MKAGALVPNGIRSTERREHTNLARAVTCAFMPDGACSTATEHLTASIWRGSRDDRRADDSIPLATGLHGPTVHRHALRLRRMVGRDGDGSRRWSTSGAIRSTASGVRPGDPAERRRWPGDRAPPARLQSPTTRPTATTHVPALPWPRTCSRQRPLADPRQLAHVLDFWPPDRSTRFSMLPQAEGARRQVLHETPAAGSLPAAVPRPTSLAARPAPDLRPFALACVSDTLLDDQATSGAALHRSHPPTSASARRSRRRVRPAQPRLRPKLDVHVGWCAESATTSPPPVGR